MKVLILAAGRSNRVKPIEDKNFLRFCGKYLIQHQLEALHEGGFTDFVLIGSAHNLERLRDFAKEIQNEREDLKINVVLQKNLDSGMAGAILSTVDAVKKGEPILIVSSNDVVESEAYRLIFDASQNEAFESYILGKRVAEYFPGGYLEVNDDWQISGIVEKPGAGNEPSDLVNLVLHFHRHSDKLYEYLEKTNSEKDDLYEVALDSMIKAGVKMQAIAYEGYWQAIKYPWHIHKVAKHYFDIAPKSIASSAEVDERTTIVGEVILDEGVRVFGGATIIGPAYIGKNSIVATNALVRDSYLGENCVVGYNTEVARSFLSDEVWTHSNYLGDSIIGDNVSFGAGSVTGNLRFDEENIKVKIDEDLIDSGNNKLGVIMGSHIRVGVNTNFMPGIKVGSHSLIGAGINVDQNIEEGSFVYGKTELKILPNKLKMLPSRQKMRKKL